MVDLLRIAIVLLGIGGRVSLPMVLVDRISLAVMDCLPLHLVCRLPLPLLRFFPFCDSTPFPLPLLLTWDGPTTFAALSLPVATASNTSRSSADQFSFVEWISHRNFFVWFAFTTWWYSQLHTRRQSLLPSSSSYILLSSGIPIVFDLLFRPLKLSLVRPILLRILGEPSGQ